MPTLEQWKHRGPASGAEGRPALHGTLGQVRLFKENQQKGNGSPQEEPFGLSQSQDLEEISSLRSLRLECLLPLECKPRVS